MLYLIDLLESKHVLTDDRLGFVEDNAEICYIYILPNRKIGEAFIGIIIEKRERN